MKITLIKQLNNSFKVAFDSDYDKLKKIKHGEPYEFEYKHVRNPKFHRKFFALMNMVFQNQERYTNLDHLRRDLTVESGYYDLRVDIHGCEVKEPKSISFASMDETDFNEYYNAVTDTIVKYFHFDKQDIIDNLEQYF